MAATIGHKGVGSKSRSWNQETSDEAQIWGSIKDTSDRGFHSFNIYKKLSSLCKLFKVTAPVNVVIRICTWFWLMWWHLVLLEQLRCHTSLQQARMLVRFLLPESCDMIRCVSLLLLLICSVQTRFPGLSGDPANFLNFYIISFSYFEQLEPDL